MGDQRSERDRGSRDAEDMPAFERDDDVANEAGAGVLSKGVTADDTGTGRHDEREVDSDAPAGAEDVDAGWAGVAELATGGTKDDTRAHDDPTPGIVDYTDERR